MFFMTNQWDSKQKDHRRVDALFAQSIAVKEKSRATLVEPIVQAAQKISLCLAAGGKIMSCGNGGSAADAQHFAAEMVNRFRRERQALAAIALTTDSSNLTAIANDYGYKYIFSRQVEALARSGDCLLAISTSGNSDNVNVAIQQAQQQQLSTIALSGRDGGAMAGLLHADDIEIRVPGEDTAHIQETHLLIIHCLCELVEQNADLATA